MQVLFGAHVLRYVPQGRGGPTFSSLFAWASARDSLSVPRAHDISNVNLHLIMDPEFYFNQLDLS